MAKFSAKDIFFKDDDMAVFGTDQDSKLYWDGSANQLRLSTTISGVTPTQDYHLTTRQYVDELFSSASGIVSNDFLFIHDSTGGTETVSGWTDVPFDVVNKQTAAFSFTVSGSEVIINVAGTYVVTGKITMTDTNNDRISTYGRLVLDTGSGYSIVPGSLFALYQADGTVADATGNTTVILDLEDGDKLKLQADGSNASSTAPLIAGGSSLVVFSPAGEKGADGTQGDQGDKGDTGFGLWASARVDGDGTVRNSYNLNVSRSATGTYDCTFNTVAPDAYYQLMGQPYQTVTDTNAMMSNVTASGFTITIGQGDNGGTPDTLADTDFSVVAFYSEGSPATSGVVDHGDLLGLEDDDHLQYVPRNGSRGFTSTVSGVDPTQDQHLTTKFYVDELFDRVVSSGIYNAYFDAYDSTGDTDVSGGWTDIPFAAERKKTADFTHDSVSSPAEVVINSPGTYVVIARVSIYQSAGNSNSEGSMQIIRDSGSGYQTVSGTVARLHSDNTNQGASTATVVALLDLELSDGLRVQAKRESGGGTLKALVNGSSLTLFPAIGIKGDKGEKGDTGAGSSVIVQDNGATLSGTTFEVLNFKSCDLEVPSSGTVDILPKFGSWYGYTIEDGQTDTSSTSWIQKATFSVAGVPTGTYRVGWYYEWQYSSRARDFQAQVQLNDSFTLASHQQEPKDSGTDQWHPVSGFMYVYLTTGSNYIDIDFRASNTSDTASIRRARIEFWREA